MCSNHSWTHSGEASVQGRSDRPSAEGKLMFDTTTSVYEILITGKNGTQLTSAIPSLFISTKSLKSSWVLAVLTSHIDTGSMKVLWITQEVRLSNCQMCVSQHASFISVYILANKLPLVPSHLILVRFPSSLSMHVMHRASHIVSFAKESIVIAQLDTQLTMK